jgi:acetyl-CoA carboxylase biotin carboxyl carrier protein
MELKEIQDLIKFVAKSGVCEVELETKGFKIVIKTNNDTKHEPVYISQPIMTTPPVVAPVNMAVGNENTSNQESAPAKVITEDTSKYKEIKSPMIGTFYRKPSPDKDLFVNVGDEIQSGKVLCIIEAMKLFNEIEAEFPCRIIKVLVDDSSPVEYDQPLFLVEPL